MKLISFIEKMQSTKKAPKKTTQRLGHFQVSFTENSTGTIASVANKLSLSAI